MIAMLLTLLLLIIALPAAAQVPSYQGKVVRIIVGYQSGDTHDLWARSYARFMGKYLPGNPEFLVQNMPGAGTMVAANYLYNIAKPDGLTLGSIAPGLYLPQVIGSKEVRFDWQKFAWIGSPEQNGTLLFMRADTNLKAWKMCATPKNCQSARQRQWVPAAI